MMADETPLSQQRGTHADWRPIPDPTDRTTADLMREVGYLRSLLEAQISSSDKLVGALRLADEKFENERDRRISEVKAESDRRLTEVATEREKALKIKEEADKEALRLDREIRQFKDEKATVRTDAAVATLEQRLVPIDVFVAKQQGEQSGSHATAEEGRAVTNTNIAAAGLATQIRSLYVAIVSVVVLGGIGLLTAIATHGFR